MSPRTGRPPRGLRPLRELISFPARIRPEVHDRLVRFAAATGQAAYQVVEQAVDEFLGRHEGETPMRFEHRGHLVEISPSGAEYWITPPSGGRFMRLAILEQFGDAKPTPIPVEDTAKDVRLEIDRAISQGGEWRP